MTTTRLVDAERERIALNIMTSAADVMGPDHALRMLGRELRSAPEELMGLPTHQMIYTAAREMALKNRVPTEGDLRLREDLRGVSSAIWDEIRAVTAGTNLGEHLEQLARVATVRRAVQAMNRASDRLMANENSASVLTDVQRDLASASRGARRFSGFKDVAPLYELATAKADGQLEGLTTGISILDAQMGGGLLPGKIMLFGALSGTGKSRFSLAMAAANLLVGKKVMYISGEMKSVPFCGADRQKRRGHEISNGIEGILACMPRVVHGMQIGNDTQRTLRAVNAWARDDDGLTIHDGEMSLQTVIDLIWEARGRGISLVIVDNLTHVINATAFRTSSENESHNKPRLVVDALAAAALATSGGDDTDDGTTDGVSVLALFQPSINREIANGRAPGPDELGQSRGIMHSAYAIVTGGRDLATVRANAEKMRLNGAHWSPAELNLLKIRGNGGKEGIVEGTDLEGHPIIPQWNDRLGVWCDATAKNGPRLDVDRYLAAHPEVERSINNALIDPGYEASVMADHYDVGYDDHVEDV